MKRLTTAGKVVLALIIVGVLAGVYLAWDKLVPKKVKDVNITTKASNLPPLAYDKNSNAPERPQPDFGNFVEPNSPQIRGHLMEWYSQTGIIYAVGGKQTTKGSIAEELGLNISLDVQNNCGKQAEDLYAFAEELSKGNANPSKGAHFIAWMGDGVPAYFSSLSKRIAKDFGEEYRPKVMMFGGASAGEDKWLLRKKYAKDARGSLTVTVIRDGDWNIAVIKSQLMGWPINFQDGTYDKEKVNFIPAPNDDYLEATKFYVSGQKVKLKIVEDGKITGRDTLIAPTGVSTWFPGDLNAVREKGGLINVASTKDFGSQMPNAIIFIDKWAKDNTDLIVKFCTMVGLGGNQVKSHMSDLQYGAKAAKEVFQSSMSVDEIVRAYQSYDVTDDDGNIVNVGGSRVFNLADAASFVGIAGGSDKYNAVYTTFGDICTQAYPEVVPDYPSYEQAVDWSYLRKAYTDNKSKAGNVSKIDFTQTTKSDEVVGDAAYSIEFETGSVIIKKESYTVLNKILGQLTIADNSFIDVSGHTDNTGSDAINTPLSKQRAEAVVSYFIAKNPELRDRISAQGFGSTKPIADNSTAAGKAKNRRVEVKLTRSSN